MKIYHILFLMFISLTAFAQNDKSNRDAFELNLEIDGEQYYKMPVEASPYFVENKVLQIYPGESLYVEVEIKQHTIASMKTVKEIKFPERTIKLDFKQIVEGNKHRNMTLAVTNPFKNKQLNYNATMFIIGHDEWIDTSIIPIYPGITGYEIWNDIIISIVLHEWRLE